MEEFGRKKGEIYLKYSLRNKQNKGITQEREKTIKKKKPHIEQATCVTI